jgi:3-dehydroquinate synthetase
MVELLVGGVSRVVIGDGVLSAETLLGDETPVSCAVIGQPGAAGIASRLAAALEGAGVHAPVITIPDGESAKSLETVEEVCRALSDAGVTREDAVAGVGGGAATDLAGFVASVYLRGIAAYLVPTTLLSAIDAAIGGKSAVNVGGKNLIGTFRHPTRVVIDLDIIRDLPPHLLRQGMAEALKTGLIGDPELFETLERDGIDADLGEVVPRALAVKARIVSRDFEERGERTHLNYGHTVGHAVETAAGVSHGEAVAIGMVAAGRASTLVAGFDAEDRQRRAIERMGLPISAPSVDRESVLGLIALDKKRGVEGTTMVLLEAIGRPRVSPVGAATVDAALAAAGIPGGDR